MDIVETIIKAICYFFAAMFFLIAMMNAMVFIGILSEVFS